MKYISLELAKKLAENWCELESDKVWCAWKYEWKWRLLDEDKNTPSNRIAAYDLIWDICIKYKKAFFWNTSSKALTSNIFNYLQDWKQQEAEDLIWSNCLFNT